MASGVGRPAKATLTLTGATAGGSYDSTVSFGDGPSGPDNPALGYLWARSRIARISDYISGAHDDELRRRIVSLGLTYNLLTKFTSFVAVDEIVRNPDGQATDVKQPLPLPKGVSNLAVGKSIRNYSEPSLAHIAGMLLGGARFCTFEAQIEGVNEVIKQRVDSTRRGDRAIIGPRHNVKKQQAHKVMNS